MQSINSNVENRVQRALYFEYFRQIFRPQKPRLCEFVNDYYDLSRPDNCLTGYNPHLTSNHVLTYTCCDGRCNIYSIK